MKSRGKKDKGSDDEAEEVLETIELGDDSKPEPTALEK